MLSEAKCAVLLYTAMPLVYGSLEIGSHEFAGLTLPLLHGHVMPLLCLLSGYPAPLRCKCSLQSFETSTVAPALPTVTISLSVDHCGFETAACNCQLAKTLKSNSKLSKSQPELHSMRKSLLCLPELSVLTIFVMTAPFAVDAVISPILRRRRMQRHSANMGTCSILTIPVRIIPFHGREGTRARPTLLSVAAVATPVTMPAMMSPR